MKCPLFDECKAASHDCEKVVDDDADEEWVRERATLCREEFEG